MFLGTQLDFSAEYNLIISLWTLYDLYKLHDSRLIKIQMTWLL